MRARKDGRNAAVGQNAATVANVDGRNAAIENAATVANVDGRNAEIAAVARRNAATVATVDGRNAVNGAGQNAEIAAVAGRNAANVAGRNANEPRQPRPNEGNFFHKSGNISSTFNNGHLSFRC